MTRTLSLTLSLVLVALEANSVRAQQWSGPADPNGPIGRSGNVGVGTTTPSEKLEVSGGDLSLWRTGSNATSQALVFKPHDVGPSDNLRKIWVEEFNLKLQIFGGSGEQFHVQDHTGRVHLSVDGNGGKIGVGTTSPSEKLEIQGGNLSLWRTGSNQSSGALIFKPHDQGPSDDLRKIWVERFNMKFQIYGGSTEQFQFQDHTGRVHLAIDGNRGNVGIGTVTPVDKLTVAGVISSTSGGVRFPDGSLQTTASLRGETGQRGEKGEKGDPGPAGPPGIMTVAVCVSGVPATGGSRSCNCRGGTQVSQVSSPCTVTANTGSCGASSAFFQGLEMSGQCCVCRP